MKNSLGPDTGYRLAAILMILLISIFYLSTLKDGHDWGDDFAMYILHAKNIAEGRNYSQTGYIFNHEKSAVYIGPHAYPPLFPLLLAPVYTVFGLNLAAMKVEIIVLFAAALTFLYLSSRKRLSSDDTLVLIALTGFSPFFWSAKDKVLADIPFLFLTCLTLYLFHVIFQPEKRWSRLFWTPILGGLLIYLSFGIRFIGIAFIPTLIILDLARHKTIKKITCLTVLFFMLFSLPQAWLIPGNRDYLDRQAIRPLWVLENLRVYGRSLVSLWDNGYSRNLAWILAILLTLLAAVGYRQRIKDGWTINEAFFLVYFLMILFWDSSQPRFLIPLFPLYFGYILEGLKSFRHLGQPAKAGAVLVLASVFITYAGAYSKKDFGPIREGPATRESVALFEFIKEKSAEGDVIIFRKPRALALYTGRQASVYPQTSDEALWEYFRRIGATVLIVGRVFPSDQEFLRPFVARQADRLEEIFKSADFQVYRVKNAL